MDQQFYVYILTNKSGSLYVGVTNNLIKRGWEHQVSITDKKGTDNPEELNFTARYNINKLVYFEVFDGPENAIAREKQLKGWSRKKKFALVRTLNPTFNDLYQEIIKSAPGVE